MGGKLSARSLDLRGREFHPDGDGLYLCVSPSLRRTWVYRFSWQGRRPEMGLGSTRDVPLAKARALRDDARRILMSGRNPIEAKRSAAIEQAEKRTFGEIADALLEAKATEWRNEKHRDQWRASLVNVAAELRPLRVDEIDTEAVLTVLKPMWIEKPETASRTRGRIEAVLDAARGLRGSGTARTPPDGRAT